MQTLATTFAGSILIGSVLGSVGLAALWSSHRILGGLLGLFIVGPAVGTGVGYLISRRDVDRLRELDNAAVSPVVRLPELASASRPAPTPEGLYAPF